MPLLVLQFDEDKGLGLLEAPLLESEVGLDIRLAECRPALSAGYAGLVVLGGIAAPDDDCRPEIVIALELIRKALARPIPVLGICLGAELLARAAEGSVLPCAPEYGYRAVRLARAGATDALLGGLPATFKALQAHEFTSEPPAKATILARSESGVQAFRLERSAWGVQFHLEPTEAMIDSWTASAPVGATLERHGIDRQVIVRDASRFTPDWVRWTPDIARRFARLVRPV